MTTIDCPRTTGLTEHLAFAALLIPTFVPGRGHVSLTCPDATRGRIAA